MSRRLPITLAGTLACLSICLVALARHSPPPDADITITPAQPQPPGPILDLQQRLESLRIEEGQILVPAEGGPVRLTPDEFAQALEANQGEASRRPMLMRLANVRSIGGLIWVGFGLLGQFIFMGRMVVQWLASERSRRSVVPVAFWWMSLCGGTMVLTYFIWRRDPVGILGQMMGWLIYVRNLWLIYRPHGRSSAPALPTDASAG